MSGRLKRPSFFQSTAEHAILATLGGKGGNVTYINRGKLCTDHNLIN